MTESMKDLRETPDTANPAQISLDYTEMTSELPDQCIRENFIRRGKLMNKVIKQSACLAVNPITVDHFAYFFNCTRWVGVPT